ncbi:MAG: Uma2 family endonuclease [Cruoricaptor ignavus]|nr:Uma2 family endonuclease [Cruoricaptor ignavus]
MEITNINQLDFNKVYSYADYLLWNIKERVELLKGRIFKMSPAPSVRHQEISMNLIGELHPLFRNQPCKFFSAPFDVRLPKQSKDNEEIYTVVQPDLCVICDENKLDERGCIGAPDLVIEIISPGNSKKELKNKFELYQEAGVKEYWIVNPLDENVLIYVLEDGIYKALQPIVEDNIRSHIFPDLKVHTDEIFR